MKLKAEYFKTIIAECDKPQKLFTKVSKIIKKFSKFSDVII